MRVSAGPFSATNSPDALITGMMSGVAVGSCVVVFLGLAVAGAVLYKKKQKAQGSATTADQSSSGTEMQQQQQEKKQAATSSSTATQDEPSMSTLTSV